MKGSEIRGVLAKNIKFFRENRLLSQADLAASSKISIPFLSEIERGNKWPFPDTLAKIANALDVQIRDLFQEAAAPPEREHDYASIVVREILIAQKEAVNSVTKQYLGEM